MSKKERKSFILYQNFENQGVYEGIDPQGCGAEPAKGNRGPERNGDRDLLPLFE